MAATFADWTERLKAYNEYIKALGEYKLNAAKADLFNAEAANMWATIHAKRLLIRQLDKDLRAYNKKKSSVKREIKAVDGKVKRFEVLLKGRRTKNFSVGWAAYRWFLPKAAMNSIDAMDKLKIPARARKPSNFFSNRKDDTRTIDSVPDDLILTTELPEWLQEKRYMIKPGKPAYSALAKLFAIMNRDAKEHRQELKDRIKAIKDETFDTWDTSFILGLGLSAAKKIEEAK